MTSEAVQHAFRAFLGAGLLWSVFFLLGAAYLDGDREGRFTGLFAAGLAAGALGAAAFGFIAMPQESPFRRWWVLGGMASAFFVFWSAPWYLRENGPVVLTRRPAFWFLLGVVLGTPDGGALGGAFRDYLATAADQWPHTTMAALGGLAVALLPVVVGYRYWRKIRWEGIWSPATLVLTLGALQVVAGGIDDFASQDLLVGLQRGLDDFVGQGMRALRSIFLIEDHRYISVPFKGLLDYLGGDRISMSLMVCAAFTPPAWILLRLFAAPDPDVALYDAGSERRKTIAFFRRDLALRAVPIFAALALVLVEVHAANLTLNPLFDPAPVPVLADDTDTRIVIPLKDRFGDFTDGKLRRYVYNYGDKEIVFIAVMKPDGSVSTCLDECEICEPAAWNKKAKGYAQRGENLVCKYCVTPISIHSVGQPGGCNPIPFPSTYDEGNIYIDLDTLISLWRQVRATEKKGTHF